MRRKSIRQPTPALNLTVAEAAYFAGLMDGEGSVSLRRSKTWHPTWYVYPLVRIANTDRSMMDWIRAHVSFGAHWYMSNMRAGHKDVMYASWESGQAVAVLRAILPYLITKRERAELAIHVWEAGQRDDSWGNRKLVPTWLKDLREVAFWQMQKWNQRGPLDAADSQVNDGPGFDDDGLRQRRGATVTQAGLFE